MKAEAHAGHQELGQYVEGRQPAPGHDPLEGLAARHRCFKGLFYEVEEFQSDRLKLTSGLVLSHEQAIQSLRLCYALTYASCQGLTLPGVVRLDTKSDHFTLKHLYVGLSRGTAADLVEVV